MSTEATPVEGIVIPDAEVVEEVRKRDWKKPALIATATLLGAAIVYRLASSKSCNDEDSDEGWEPAPVRDETSPL